MIESLRIGEASLSYSVHGQGPGLLVPWCNFPWPDMQYLDTNDEVLQSFGTTADFGAALAERGVAILTLEGCDHLGAFLALGNVVEEIMSWLERETARNGDR